VSTAAEAGETAFTKVIDSTSICGYPFGCFDFGESPPGRRRRYPEPHLAMDEEGNLAFFSGRLVAIVDGRIHGTSVPEAIVDRWRSISGA
jgi:hypothetical protein